MGFFVVCRKVSYISVAQICVLSVLDGLSSTFIYLYTCSRTVSHSDGILRLFSVISLVIVLAVIIGSGALRNGHWNYPQATLEDNYLLSVCY